MRLVIPVSPIMPGGGSGFTTVMATGWDGTEGKGPATDDTGGKEAGSRVKVLCNFMLRTRKKREKRGILGIQSKTFTQ